MGSRGRLSSVSWSMTSAEVPTLHFPFWKRLLGVLEIPDEFILSTAANDGKQEISHTADEHSAFDGHEAPFWQRVDEKRTAGTDPGGTNCAMSPVPWTA